MLSDDLCLKPQHLQPSNDDLIPILVAAIDFLLSKYGVLQYIFELMAYLLRKTHVEQDF